MRDHGTSERQRGQPCHAGDAVYRAGTPAAEGGERSRGEAAEGTPLSIALAGIEMIIRICLVNGRM